MVAAKAPSPAETFPFTGSTWPRTTVMALMMTMMLVRILVIASKPGGRLCVVLPPAALGRSGAPFPISPARGLLSGPFLRRRRSPPAAPRPQSCPEFPLVGLRQLINGCRHSFVDAGAKRFLFHEFLRVVFMVVVASCRGWLPACSCCIDLHIVASRLVLLLLLRLPAAIARTTVRSLGPPALGGQGSRRLAAEVGLASRRRCRRSCARRLASVRSCCRRRWVLCLPRLVWLLLLLLGVSAVAVTICAFRRVGASSWGGERLLRVPVLVPLERRAPRALRTQGGSLAWQPWFGG
jgi:hypothetical protein